MNLDFSIYFCVKLHVLLLVMTYDICFTVSGRFLCKQSEDILQNLALVLAQVILFHHLEKKALPQPADFVFECTDLPVCLCF